MPEMLDRWGRECIQCFKLGRHGREKEKVPKCRGIDRGGRCSREKAQEKARHNAGEGNVKMVGRPMLEKAHVGEGEPGVNKHAMHVSKLWDYVSQT